MKIYIAAPYPYRDEAIQVKNLLEAEGHTITSRWLIEEDEMCDKDARKDLEDIRAAEALLAINPPEWANRGTGGRHVELGYALALGKIIVLAGARTSMFHFISDVQVLDSHTSDAIIKALAGR